MIGGAQEYVVLLQPLLILLNIYSVDWDELFPISECSANEMSNEMRTRIHRRGPPERAAGRIGDYF